MLLAAVLAITITDSRIRIMCSSPILPVVAAALLVPAPLAAAAAVVAATSATHAYHWRYHSDAFCYDRRFQGHDHDHDQHCDGPDCG